MSVWDRRCGTLTRECVAQNMVMGARYFRYEVLGLEGADPDTLRLADALAVLEEVSRHGRCVISLPDGRHLALYAVHPEDGTAEVAMYERVEVLAAPAR